MYVGLLDIKKAPDTVCQHGMFGRLIRNFYKHSACQVHFGSLSELFEALQVYTRAHHAPHFSALFEKELLKFLKKLRESVKIYNINVPCLAFSDDVSLVALSKYNL